MAKILNTSKSWRAAVKYPEEIWHVQELGAMLQDQLQAAATSVLNS